jgi:hypothetical protein
MDLRFRAASALLPVLLWGASGAPVDFSILIQARCGSQEQTATGHPNRPVLTAKAGAPIRVQWSVANGDKPGVIHDVTLHCFLAREQAPGQRELPKLGPDAPYESALTMDFEPKARGSADFTLQAPAAGIYLLRVETMGAGKEHGHEHSADMEVRVQ